MASLQGSLMQPGMVSVDSDKNLGTDRYSQVMEDAAPTPLLTAEEEMQYQRALWVNRLLKEQLAAQTQGLSLKEIEDAQSQIQARMREAARLQAWGNSSHNQVPPGVSGAQNNRSLFGRSPRRSHTQNARPAHTSTYEVNRRRDRSRIKEENSALLNRLESVKSTFAPRTLAASLIPKISPRNRLLGSGH
eukprot:TRINITY_DN37174_c0_g1_i1.p1 TRINITY_DN37174_c0_g1~~TRINITY_DN37174_c0_g1_i1.p1  ORF type:complete len:190 (-),score=34.37 TRINITY_DN37174_c0_g1_i1:155-724(-)